MIGTSTNRAAAIGTTEQPAPSQFVQRVRVLSGSGSIRRARDSSGRRRINKVDLALTCDRASECMHAEHLDDSPCASDRRCSHRTASLLQAREHDADIACYATWLAPRIAQGAYVGFIADDSGQAFGGVGAVLLDRGLTRGDRSAARARIVNLFTERSWRRRGKPSLFGQP